MAQYRITVSFTDEQLQLLNQQGYLLCFDAGMQSPPTFDVIAWASPCLFRMEIEWQAQYLTAATGQNFEPGVMVPFSTGIFPVQPQQRYVLSQNGDIQGSPDNSLPPSSWLFANGSQDSASAIVLMPINGQATPFYVTPEQIQPNSQTLFTPSNTVALWLQQNVQSNTMASNVNSVFGFTAINTTGKNSISLQWNGSNFVEQE